jgi:hypothetical protein
MVTAADWVISTAVRFDIDIICDIDYRQWRLLSQRHDRSRSFLICSYQQGSLQYYLCI